MTNDELVQRLIAESRKTRRYVVAFGLLQAIVGLAILGIGFWLGTRMQPPPLPPGLPPGLQAPPTGGDQLPPSPPPPPGGVPKAP